MISVTKHGIVVPVDETINFYGVKLMAIEHPDYDCNGCVLDGDCGRDLMCVDDERPDVKNVIFKEVEV